jgi:HSP20 family protein
MTTMTLTHFSHPFGRTPWRDFGRMQAEVERLFDRTRSRLNDSYAPGFPVVNIWSGEDEVVLSAELPGVDPEKIDIAVVDDTVTLSGTRSVEDAPEGAVIHHRERGYGEFSRSFRLPFRIDAASVDARYANGILEVKLPKAAEDRPRKVPVLTA